MIISVIGGKGGIGKTTVATNFALSLINLQFFDCYGYSACLSLPTDAQFTRSQAEKHRPESRGRTRRGGGESECGKRSRRAGSYKERQKGRGSSSGRGNKSGRSWKGL